MSSLKRRRGGQPPRSRALARWLTLLLTMLAALQPATRLRAQCVQWVERTDVGAPGPRANCAMAYDSDRGVTVMFGGSTYLPLVVGQWASYYDTWEYDGNHWTQITLEGDTPPARAYSAMCYDTVRHEIVMAGGAEDNESMNDTWTYHSTGPGHGTWTRKTDLGEPNHLGDNFERAGHGLVFDTKRGVAILMGGTTSGWTGAGAPPTQRSSEVWEWDGVNWRYVVAVFRFESPGIGAHYEGPTRHGMVFDSANGVPVIAGGAYYHYLSSAYDDWEDIDWSLLFPMFPDRRYATPVYNSPRAGTVGTGIGARQQMGIAYDSTRGRVVIFGGKLTDTSPNPDPGRFHTEVKSHSLTNGEFRYETQDVNLLTLPSAREGAAMVYDSRRHRTILFGGARGTTTFSDTWELSSVPFGSFSLLSWSNACYEEPLTISALVDDTRPFVYRWYECSPGGPLNLLADQTNQTLHLLTNQYLGSHRFMLNIEDACGNQATNSVDVFTGRRPSISSFITTGASSQCPGGAISFRGVVESDFPVTLQWYRDSFPIAGANADALNLVNLRHEDSGNYHLVASNYCGVYDTADFYLASLQVGVTITAQPAYAITSPCNTADFLVQARGVGELHYQWRMDGIPLPDGGWVSGAVSNHLHLDPVLYDRERTFDVVITDDCGPSNAVTSAPADLYLPTPPWIEVAMSPAPPEQQLPRGHWSSAFDEHRGVMVMYGGTDYRGYAENSLWEYDGLQWKAVQDAFAGVDTSRGQPLLSGNSAPATHAAAYNPDDHRVYVFGDYSRNFPLSIWTWDGTQWTMPYSGPLMGGEQAYRAVYDRLSHRFLITRTHDGGYGSEMLLYDPASNQLAGPNAMQPPLEPGVFRAFWEYDEYRQSAFWYQNDGVGFGPATMWAYGPAGTWSRLAGNPTALPARLNVNVEYDPVRRHTVALGAVDIYPWDSATRVFPGSRANNAFPASLEWFTLLPDGPPRNPGGLGVSPPNDFLAETLVFDRRRRAMVAAGLSGADPCCEGVPRPTWHTYEYRYVDRIEIDSQPSMVWAPSGANASLSVRAVGAGNVSFRWRHDGQDITEGPSYGGTTNATLTVTNVSDLTPGNYDVVISNRCGVVVSKPIVLSYSGAAALGLSGSAGAGVNLNLVGEPGVEVTVQSAVSPYGPWIKVQNVIFPASGTSTLRVTRTNSGSVFYRSVFPAY